VGVSGGSITRVSAVVSEARNNFPRNVPKPLQRSSLKRRMEVKLSHRRNGLGIATTAPP